MLKSNFSLTYSSLAGEQLPPFGEVADLPRKSSPLSELYQAHCTHPPVTHEWRFLSLTLIPWRSMWLVLGGRPSPVTIHAQAPPGLGRRHAEGGQHPWGSPPWDPEELHQLTLVPMLCLVLSPESSQFRLSLPQGFRKTYSQRILPPSMFSM